MRSSSILILLAALALVGLPVKSAVADGLVVPVSNVSGTISPLNTLDHTYFIYAYSTGPLFTDVGVGFQSLGIVKGGVTNSYSFDSPVDPSKYLRYAVAGQYEVSGVPTNVAVALRADNNPAGQSWDTYFNTGAGSGNAQFNEPAVYAGLSSGDASLLSQFALYSGQFHGIPLNSPGNIWNFSDGASGGTVVADVFTVPEPSAGLLLAMGSLVMLGCRFLSRRKFTSDR